MQENFAIPFVSSDIWGSPKFPSGLITTREELFPEKLQNNPST